MIAIRHPAYLALTDGECGVPHRGVTACNDIRVTMRPDTHFSVPILPGHRLAPLLDPSPPLISAGMSRCILTEDKVLCTIISKSKAHECTRTHIHVCMGKHRQPKLKQKEETSKK